MNDFDERSFSDKTNEIDGKLTRILRTNKINIFRTIEKSPTTWVVHKQTKWKKLNMFISTVEPPIKNYKKWSTEKPPVSVLVLPLVYLAPEPFVVPTRNLWNKKHGHKKNSVKTRIVCYTALRSYLLFRLLTVASSVSIFFLYSITFFFNLRI